MKFSWKKSVFTLFTGLLITGCATSNQKPKNKPRPLLMNDRGGVVPQPFLEPKAEVVNAEPILNVDPIIMEPDMPIVPVAVEPVKPIEVTPKEETKTLAKYTVVKGDSLSRIAYKYNGFTYLDLAKVNNIDVKKSILIGASRKSMIDKISSSPVENRLAGTIALHLEALRNGASILRVHDVAEHIQALRVQEALDKL